MALRYRLSAILALALMRPPARYFECDAFSHFGTDVHTRAMSAELAERIVAKT
jgi:hypothetical protein